MLKTVHSPGTPGASHPRCVAAVGWCNASLGQALEGLMTELLWTYYILGAACGGPASHQIHATHVPRRMSLKLMVPVGRVVFSAADGFSGMVRVLEPEPHGLK